MSSEDIAAAALADYGYLYVPEGCDKVDTQCKVHVHFHGCMMSNQVVYDKDTDPPTLMEDWFVRQYGLLNYASTNNIIMVFPQNNEQTKLEGNGF